MRGTAQEVSAPPLPQGLAMHVVGAAIVRGKRCLLARRGPGQGDAGCWELPGGKVEPDESPREALEREIAEEMELRVHVGRWLGRGLVRRGDGLLCLDVYLAELRERSPIRLIDHDAWGWFDVGELRALKWPEADLPVLPSLEAYLASVGASSTTPPR